MQRDKTGPKRNFIQFLEVFPIMRLDYNPADMKFNSFRDIVINCRAPELFMF